MLVLPPDRDEALKNSKKLIFRTAILLTGFHVGISFAINISNYTVKLYTIIGLLTALFIAYYLAVRKLKLKNEAVELNFPFSIEEQLKLQQRRRNILILGTPLFILFLVALIFAGEIEDTTMNIVVLSAWCTAFLGTLYAFLQKY